MRMVVSMKRARYSIAEEPAPALHCAHPQECAALRIVLVTVPRDRRSCEHFPDGSDLHFLVSGKVYLFLDQEKVIGGENNQENHVVDSPRVDDVNPSFATSGLDSWILCYGKALPMPR